MLVFTDRKFNTVCLANTKAVPLLEDHMDCDLDSGTKMITVSLPKNLGDVNKVIAGNFVFANGYGKKEALFEVIDVYDTANTKEVIAEDVGLDLLNEEAEPIKMKATLREHVRHTLGEESFWDIGLIEIDEKRELLLEYTGASTVTKRINEIAGRFGTEVSYSFELAGDTVSRLLVNFHKERGKETGIRLEAGREVEGIKRRMSIADLCTAVRPVGKTIQETIKITTPYNLLRDSNRLSSTKNYKVGEWQFVENIKEGEEVTLTFKGYVSPLQKFRIYNSGSNHAVAFLEKISEGMYSATFKWSVGVEGNTSLWAYQYPNRGDSNETCIVEWAVLSKGNKMSYAWVPSKAEEVAEVQQDKPVTTAAEATTTGITDGDARVEKMVQWFKSKEGKVGYNDGGGRFGPDAYDCSSSILISAKHAGLVPSSAPTSNTATMWTWAGNGTHFYQIPAYEVRRGDIFISRSASSANSGRGHTGLFLDNGKTIIHTTVGAGKRGIMTTPARGWIGPGGVRYCRFNVLRDTPSQPTGSMPKVAAPANGKYWTHAQIIHHDIGKTLQGITAQQLNNWIKAKSPSSPFNGQGAVFLEAQKQSGLDARIILAHAAHESAWGKSNIAKNLHNYFGINAVDSDPYNGAKKSQNAGFKEGIINGAKWVANRYYNSDYKQTTLYKMRWNNGVHEYASDTAWHTKIANIAKGSEKFTVAASLGESESSSQTAALKDVKDVKYEDQVVDVAVNLIGYKYDDGRYYVNEKGVICDREGLENWGRFAGYQNEKTGHILRVYNSEATTQKAIFDEGLLQLKKNNAPKISYEVELSHFPDGIEEGDTVRIIDHDFNPPLYVDARVSNLTLSISDPKSNKVVLTNFKEMEGGLNARVVELMKWAKSLEWKYENQPYIMSLESSMGNVFKDGIINTDLRANLTKAGIDQTSMVDYFIWERVSAYQDKLSKTDDAWNDEALASRGNIKNVSADDVDLEASFTCSAVVDGVVVASAAYTIKDLTIGQYKQDEEPDVTQLNWGDIWQSVDSDPPFKKIWKGDVWEDVIIRRDIDQAKEEVKSEVTEEIGEIVVDKVDEKIGDTVNKVNDLEVLYQLTADKVTLSDAEIKAISNQRAIEEQYIKALKDAIDSDEENTLSQRLDIIEANVGAGKASIEAINTYLEFAEEGLLIGKKENPVKLRLINDSLVITDGGKIVARFAFNQTETPNLKVPGVFDFANHTATKGEEGTKQTIIRYSGG